MTICSAKYLYWIPFIWGILGELFIAQAQIEFVQPSQFIENAMLLNPAYAGHFSDKELNTHFISFSGIRQAYRTAYLNGYTHLPKRKVILGGSITADIEEDFSQITQTKFLFTYQLFKTETQKFQAGAEIGLVNYYLEATPFTPALSKWNVNGNYGVFYQYKKWNIGLSLNNLFHSKIQTIDSELYFYRYITLLNEYQWRLTSYLDLKMGIQMQWKKELDDVYRLENQWILYEKYFVAFSVWNTDLLFLGGGLKEINLGKRKLKIQMMYAYNLSSKLLGNTNQYEIGIKYY